VGLSLSVSPGYAADGPAGPGWLEVQGTPVTPQEADAHYQSLSTFSTQDITTESATTTTPEITALARSLKNDPKLIYEYVRNNVDYVPYFGSLKGATLTYLDGSGNDFDQASLMISLLRASGITAQYVYGTMSIPASGDANQKDMQHWLGVDANSSVISTVLSNGGIPGYQSGYNWIVNRVWVQATISGVNYLFDPAFKPHQTTQGINLQNAMGYSKSALLSAAAGTVGTDYVQNLNEAGLKSTLDGYTLNLANYIKANYPNASTSEIIGGRTIVPQTLTSLPTSLDFPTTPQGAPWTDIPDAYVHKIRIIHGKINQLLNIPDLAGQKLSIVYKTGTITTASEMIATPLTDPQTTITPADPVDTSLPGVPVTGASVDGGTTGGILPMSGTYSQDFGKIYPASAGASSSSVTWGPITNPNSVTVQIVVTLTSNPNGAFSITQNSGTNNVGAGASISPKVVFTNAGQTAGTKTGQLHIQWFYGGNPISGADYYYNLTGVVANASDTTGSYGLNFGTPYLGYPVDGTVRLKNSASLALSITGVSLTGTDTSRFQITGGNQTGTLTTGQYRDINVRYLANSVGTHSANAQVTYTYDGLSYTMTLGLSGQTLSTPVAQLWLDDTLLAEETEPVTAVDLNKLTVAITHPYTTNNNDQSVDYTLKRGSTYAIIYDFGGSRLGRVQEKRERQMQTYRETGYGDTSRQVLTESLNVIGMTWMRNTTLNDNLIGQLAGVIDLRHHRFGIVAQETGYYIDVKQQMLSVTSIHGDTATKDAYVKARNFPMSAHEHGVLEQLQSNSPSVSTVKLLQLNNSNAKKVFMTTSANFAAIKPLLINYSAQDLADFQTSVTNGNTLILPENGKIALQSWSGKGYIDFNTGGTSQHYSMIIGGGYNGGYSAYAAPVAITP
ncbi:MAG: transglutaminase domain-containing protein, partial [Pedobacter sp.]